MTTEGEAGLGNSTDSPRPKIPGLDGPLLRWKRRLASVDRHIAAALIMVVISVFGAIAAFEVALAEQTSVGLERRLSIGQLEDIGIRQDLFSEQMYRIGLETETRNLDRESTDLKSAAAGFAGADKRALTWLDWHAAELHTQKNALNRYTYELANLSDDDGTAGDVASKRSARQLRNDGFGAVAKEEVVKFPLLETAISQAHEAAPALALCVLLFVAGLVCFTVAELELGPLKLWWGLAGAGSALAIVGAIAMASIDPGLWFLAPIAAALAGALVFAVRKELFSQNARAGNLPHPETPEPARVPLAYLSGHSGHDNWSRGIVGLIAISVFFTAVFGWGYSLAVKEAGVAALSAQETKTMFVTREGTLVGTVAGGVFESAIRLQAVRTRCAAAAQLSALARDGLVEADLQRAKQGEATACGEVQTLYNKETLDRLTSAVDGGDLVDGAASPARMLREQLLDMLGGPNELLAVSDTKTAISANRLNRSAKLLAVLTVLAIVLFLFGQAHSMGNTSAGRLIGLAAVGLLTISLAMGAFAFVGKDPVAAARRQIGCVGKAKLSSPEDVARLGAEKYALGLAAFHLGAENAPGSADRAEADKVAAPNLKCAMVLLPDFLPAYERYHEALSRIASPQRDESWLSLANRPMLKEIYEANRDELRAANRAGLLRSSARLSDFAFDATRYALVEGNRRALDEGRIALDALIHRDDSWKRRFERWRRPELFTDEDKTTFDADWFNLGLLELATGDPKLISDAQHHYDLGVADPKSNMSTHAAGALVDLELLRTYCPNLYRTGPACGRISAAVDTIRGRVANIVSRDALPSNSSASASGFRITVTPYSADWRASIKNFDPGRDRLAVVWYRDDSRDGGAADKKEWRVRRALESLMEVYGPGRSSLPKPTGEIVQHATSVILEDSSCLGAGRYAADLFLNGILVGSASADLDTVDLSIVRTRELDLEGCLPSTWERYGGKGQEWRADAPSRTFILKSADETKFGLAMATYFAPSDMAESERKPYFLRRTIDLILKKGQPGEQWTAEAEHNLLNQATELNAIDASCGTSTIIGGLVYRYIESSADKNVVHIVVVNANGPAQAFCPIIKSFANYYSD